ncbi:hypothetical protein [Candidatus Palauibacter sp.]|uniref:hypothetical protein n=1 Tax=Candidatus Palauibacter sp. TaxID=3101350 RepID=UPI003C6F038B
MIRRAEVIALLLPLSIACNPEGSVEVEPGNIWSEANDVRRRFASVVFDTLWTYGSIDDTVLQMPGEIVPAPHGGVYVFDLAASRAVHIDEAGRVAWVWGRRGQGPGEFMDVRALSEDHDGGIVLADHGNGRIVRLDPDGNLVREVPLLIEASYVDGIAAVEGGYALYTNGEPSLMIVNEDGREKARLANPSVAWEGIHWMQRTGDVVSWSGDAWVLGFEVGNGWYVIRGDSIAAYPYVEHTSFPVMTVTVATEGATTTTTQRLPRVPYSGSTLSVRGDTLGVFFEGRSPDRNRTLDLYDLTTGAYIHSVATPRASDVVLAEDGTIYLLSRRSGLYSIVTALKPRKGGNS